MPPTDNALTVLIDCFIESGEPSPRHMDGVAMGRREGAGGQQGTTLSASWEAVMSRAEEINRFHDGFPGLLFPPPSQG